MRVNSYTQKVVGSATVKAPGTCGELAQGKIGGEHFLITCPIDTYAVASVELTEGDGIVHGPEDCPKSRRAVELTIKYLNAGHVDAQLSLASSLPRGKGMASSTADVAAAIQATSLALRAPLTPSQVAEIALRVEPSDAIMFPGIALFDHREGRTIRLLGDPPPMRVLILDFGGGVDTLEYNSRNGRVVNARHERQWQEAADLICEGIRLKDVGVIGRGAIISARAHQETLHKKRLDDVIDLSSEVGAAGVNVAHSGTVIGMLFEDDDALVENAACEVRRRFPDLQNVSSSRVIGGGLVQVEQDGQEETNWHR